MKPEQADPLWEQLAPLLNQGMARLGDADYNAVVLRYFENKTLTEVGVALGMEERAAQKRVSRALEKLHRYFNRRGVSSTTAVIAEAISSHSVQAAPTALAKSVTAVAMTKGVAARGSTLTLVKGALEIMAWIKAKSVIGVGAALLLAVGAVTTAVSQSQDQGKEMVGIGFSSYLKDERSGIMMILNIAPKSPAAEAGLPLHRVIVIRKINAIPVASKTMTEWKNVLDAPIGTKVRFELIIDAKSKETKTVELVSGKYLVSNDHVLLKSN